MSFFTTSFFREQPRTQICSSLSTYLVSHTACSLPPLLFCCCLSSHGLYDDEMSRGNVDLSLLMKLGVFQHL